MKQHAIICLILVLSLSFSAAHGIYYNNYNEDFDSYSRTKTSSYYDYHERQDYRYDKYDYKYQRSNRGYKYSDIMGSEFKYETRRRVWDEKPEYYLRYSKTFDKKQAIKCHDSAPENKLFYVKC